jgi:hypothetical protein
MEIPPAFPGPAAQHEGAVAEEAVSFPWADATAVSGAFERVTPAGGGLTFNPAESWRENRKLNFGTIIATVL